MDYEADMTQPGPEAVSLEALLAPRADTESGFPEEWVSLRGVGKVRVRGLSRKEVLMIQKVAKGIAEIERLTLSRGMVKPSITEDQAKAWQSRATMDELDPVTATIARLSGMEPRAGKQAYMDFEADPGSEFRSLPGGEAGHDGGNDADRPTSPAVQR